MQDGPPEAAPQLVERTLFLLLVDAGLATVDGRISREAPPEARLEGPDHVGSVETTLYLVPRNVIARAFMSTSAQVGCRSLRRGTTRPTRGSGRPSGGRRGYSGTRP